MTSKSCKRAKASTPLSQLPSAVPAAACLNPSQVADWLQVALWAGQDDEVVKVWRRYRSICRFPHGAPPPRRRPCATRSSGKPRSPSGSRHSARPRQRRLSYRLYQNARRCPQGRRGAQRSVVAVAEQASVAHLQTLSYVYLRLGKSWDQLLVDTQILDREPQNKTALASLMATLTRNRIDSPALGGE